MAEVILRNLLVSRSKHVADETVAVVGDGALLGRRATTCSSAPVKFLIEVCEHVLDDLLVVLFLFCFRSLHWLILRLGILKLAVPDLLDLVDLLRAEFEPALQLGALLDALVGLIFVSTAVLVVQGLLGEVAKLERDLADLAHVEAGGQLAGGVVEVGVGLQLVAHEILHSLQVLLVEGLADVVQN